MRDDAGSDHKRIGDHKLIFSVMIVMGLALSLAALFLLDCEVGIVGSCCWVGGWLLGAGFVLWTMSDCTQP